MYHMYFEIWSCSISSAPYALMKRKSVLPLLSVKVRAIDNVWWCVLNGVSVCVCMGVFVWHYLTMESTVHYLYLTGHIYFILFGLSYIFFLQFLVYFTLLICYSNNLIPAIGTVTEESKWLKINWVTVFIKYAALNRERAKKKCTTQTHLICVFGVSVSEVVYGF